MTPEQEEVLRRDDPQSWVVYMLAVRFHERNIARDAEMMRLIGVVLHDACKPLRARIENIATMLAPLNANGNTGDEILDKIAHLQSGAR